jgi:hypothetical protein
MSYFYIKAQPKSYLQKHTARLSVVSIGIFLALISFFVSPHYTYSTPVTPPVTSPDPEPTVEPTTTPTPMPVATSSSSGSSTSTSSSSNNNSGTPPVCNESAPGGSPYIHSSILGANSITLRWTEAPDPVTYYLVAYGTESGYYIFGNSNIGGKGTTEYTVNHLSGNTKYYFVVRAGNGCKPGPFSNEISAIPAGTLVTNPADGFEPGVLGDADSEATSSAKSYKDNQDSDIQKNIDATQIESVNSNAQSKSRFSFSFIKLLGLFGLLAITTYHYRNRLKKNLTPSK